MSKTPSVALIGLKILDLSRVRAGPSCVRLFADFGADVVKVEAPEGLDPNDTMSGPRDGYDMQNLHRNKRSLTLNLKSDAGRDIFLRLVETADVVVENFRPDVKNRLGIGYDVLAKVNPRIILASISGYGETGPYRLHGGFDQIAQGMGGLMWLTGMPGQGPLRAGIALADLSAGLYAAVGILVALRERELSGQGQWVQTSLLEAQISMLDFQAARFLVDGIVPEQSGNDHPYITPMGVFETAQGFINIGVAGESLWRRFCVAIGEPELANDPRFETQDDRLRNRALLNQHLAVSFKTRSAAAWTDLLNEAGIPSGPIYKVNEVFDDPQVRHSGIARPVVHAGRGEIRVVGTPICLSRTPPEVVSALPERGQHNAEILDALGFDQDAIDSLRREQVI